MGSSVFDGAHFFSSFISLVLLSVNLNSIVITPLRTQIRIVGIGASAGGLQALEEFLGAIPLDTGFAFVVVQHLSQDHKSNLTEILSRSTTLPVELLKEDVDPVANTVYVRPPNKEVTVGTGLELFPRVQSRDTLYLPIDDFFFSLAKSREDRAIAIVLSGMGSDGSRGVQEVKENGGLVLIQSPESAQFSGMPSSAIRLDVADFIGTAEDIARKLGVLPELEARTAEIIINDPVGELNSDTFVAAIINRIRATLKLDFQQYRPSTIGRRIEKRLLIHQLSDFREYLNLLSKDNDELRTLAQSFLIGVTRFFRDPDAFHRIKEKVLPELTKLEHNEQPLRIWVPACSTGEEAYTMAMVVDDYLKKNGIDRDFKILASDIDGNAIRLAGDGFFSENIRADVPEEFLAQYFISVVGGYRIISSIRERILFAVQNLMSDPPFIRIDLLSCRNFLIYINSEAQNSILSNFHFALNPNGFMMLGPSESLGKHQQAFRMVDRRWKIFSRNTKNLSLPLNTRRIMPGLPIGVQGFPQTSQAPPEETPRELKEAMNDHFAQYLADRYAPATLFVSSNYNIHYLNGDFDGLFHFPRHYATFSLDKVLPEQVHPVLIAAVETILTEGNGDNDDGLTVSLTFPNGNYVARLRKVSLTNRQEPMVMIEFDPGDVPEDSDGTHTEILAQNLLNRQIGLLRERLSESNQRAQKLLAELEATNEELQTSNRELLASNEEMQSVNEELQSVNEELHSVNSEVQRKNDQLRILNSDINHLLESTEIGTLFLDEDLLIRRFTPTIRFQFDLHITDIGRPLSAFSSSFTDLDLTKKCTAVLSTFQRYEEEVVDRNGNDYLLRILPYRDPKEGGGGLVVTFINISDLMEARAELDALARRYEAIIKFSEDPVLLVNRSGRVEQINFWLHGQPSAENVKGKYFTDFIDEDAQQIIFTNALRHVFDNHEASKQIIRLNGEDGNGTYIEVSFIPLPLDEGKVGKASEETAMLIVIDKTELLREQYETSKLLDNYKSQLRKSKIQGGIMDLNGNIIDLTESKVTSLSPQDFINRNVYEYLTDSGKAKINEALFKIRNGSFRETVHYYVEDLNLPESVEYTVAYEPLIFNGEVIFVVTKNASGNEA